MDFDEILPFVGEYGMYQKLMIWFVLLPGTIPCGFNAYSQLFMATNLDHWCKIPELQYLLPEQQDLFKNISIPLENIDGNSRYSRCFMRKHNYSEMIENGLEKYPWYENAETVPIVPCRHGWNYNILKYESTIITEVN
ncbi:Beta-alanine transporter [Carabus blaptoides fortunei]